MQLDELGEDALDESGEPDELAELPALEESDEPGKDTPEASGELTEFSATTCLPFF